MTEISSKDNPLIKKITKLNKSSKFRREQQLFVCEGLRISTDAMLSSAPVEYLLYTSEVLEKFPNEINKLINYSNTSYCVKKSVFNQISDTKSPQGVLCVIKTLDKVDTFDKIKENGKFLALENIQDPNNLGTIFRTAEALGINGIVMTKDCCDVTSPKVVRGTMGAVFRIPYLIVESINSFLDSNPKLNSYAAVVDSSATSLTDIAFNTPCVAVIGNEGNGLKDVTVSHCNVKFTIQMSGRAESLNASVAGSIVMWEMTK